MRPFAAWATLFTSLSASVLAQTQITVNVASLLQEIDGFGVSQAFTRAREFYETDPIPRQKGLDYLFSTETGAGLTIIRNRIGSTTNDSILPRSPGSPSGAPQYVWDKSDSRQVWFSQEARKYGVTTIYADAWSAPAFMKTNNNEANGGWLCGVTGRSCASGDWRQAFANMLVQYVKYYADEGVPVTHLGFLNEPDYVVSYSSMQSDGNQAASFIPTLYNTLQSNNITNVGLACCDSIGWPGQRTMTSQLVAAGMERYLQIITSHMYTGDPNSPMATRLKTWQTEGCDLQSRWCTTWYSNGGLCEGMTWANKLHTGIVSANLSAYIYWQGFEVNQFQAASYLVASDGKEVIPSGRLWAFAMWSRFIRPGARRVSSSGSVSNVGYGAFKNLDNSVVLVFTSNSGSAQNVRIGFQSFTPTSAIAFVTDNSRAVASLAVTLASNQVTVAIPPRSVVTVQLNKVIGPAPNPITSAPVSSTSALPLPTSTASACAINKYGQCGGQGWNGCTTCATGSACTVINVMYSQCL
ncbi:xylanase [Coprinopsis marcescibilis]|uniref:Xylanase n=1 Tax=Coprinopsis marcescibilis TaxID=230819 RepID=A0A5C3KEQ9_COPMA|nr:xylanase [Coprinopsis marcescibilis]